MDFNAALFNIKKGFLRCVPVKEIQWMDILRVMTMEQQEELIAATVNNPLNLKYPVKVEYQIRFMKYIINNLEERQLEIDDSVYDTFGRLVALNGDIAFCYKHYLVENKVVSMKENVSIVSEGTTGLCSWQASLALAEWVLGNKAFFQRKSVLELGSGTGLLGAVVAMFTQAKKMCFSDSHLSVLQLLKENLKMNVECVENVDDNRVLLSGRHNETEVAVLNLPWEIIDDDVRDAVAADVVLAADVVYDSSLFSSLINALKCLLSERSCSAVLACTERNKATFEDFLHQLGKTGLIIEEIERVQQQSFMWNADVPVRFILIKMKC